jgi:hypothetical protein
VQCFCDHSLTGEGCVTVKQQWQNIEGLVAWKLILFGSDDALEDGIDGL